MPSSSESESNKAEAEKIHMQCEKRKNAILGENGVMKFMLEQMAQVKCALDPRYFVCRPCVENVGGKFTLDEGIVLCENHYITDKVMAETMIHETIHAYDHARVKLDWHNIRHHACSEIRAANLSGDCRIVNEFARGKLPLNFAKHHQHCVKRRASLSISMNPACKGHDANAIVDEVFDACFKDTSPFDEIY